MGSFDKSRAEKKNQRIFNEYSADFDKFLFDISVRDPEGMYLWQSLFCIVY